MTSGRAFETDDVSVCGNNDHDRLVCVKESSITSLNQISNRNVMDLQFNNDVAFSSKHGHDSSAGGLFDMQRDFKNRLPNFDKLPKSGNQLTKQYEVRN